MSTSAIDSPLTIQRKAFPQAALPPKPPLIGRFSFFASKSSTSKLADPHDEIIDLDISKALFPAGPADPFSPAAFKNLVQNAEGLLLRIQAAYKELALRMRELTGEKEAKAEELALRMRELTGEKEAQAEELAESETRAKHLKIQLDDMAAKLAKQDEVVMNLVDDLAQEKQMRREEGDARMRSVQLVQRPKAKAFGHCGDDPESPNAEENRRQSDGGSNSLATDSDRRQSDGGSSSLVTDSGFESDEEEEEEEEEESVVDSVFSKGQRDLMSSAASDSSFSTNNSPALYHRLSPRNPSFYRSRLPPRNPSSSYRSHLHDSSVLPPPPHPSIRLESCSNCHGAKSSHAWGMVLKVKEENRILNARLTKLEDAVDGCLDLITLYGV